MNALDQQIAGSMKQTFFHYQQRRTGDNRGAQKHLGPSEIGTPCDRQLVMKLLNIQAVNPGGDEWASFIGTQGHAGVATMFDWADAGTGRYVTEMRLQLPSETVPRGTADHLDRQWKLLLDHKFLGRWSMAKLRRAGPSPTYRKQVQIYGYAASLKGEKIKHVGIVAWPRDQNSLDDLYVWTEPYDKKVGKEALKRVDDLSAWANNLYLDGATEMDIAKQAGFDSESCLYCPFHAPGDKTFERGCNGKE